MRRNPLRLYADRKLAEYEAALDEEADDEAEIREKIVTKQQQFIEHQFGTLKRSAVSIKSCFGTRRRYSEKSPCYF